MVRKNCVCEKRWTYMGAAIPGVKRSALACPNLDLHNLGKTAQKSKGLGEIHDKDCAEARDTRQDYVPTRRFPR